VNPKHTPEPSDSAPATTVIVGTLPGGGEVITITHGRVEMKLGRALGSTVWGWDVNVDGEAVCSGVIAEAETVDAARAQAVAATTPHMHSLTASHDLDALAAACLDAVTPAHADADDPNAAHLTAAQVDALLRLCGRYSVAFNPAAYRQPSDLPTGWVAGWVGPIYIGCGPEGRISS
jgi:hypothetical protein